MGREKRKAPVPPVGKQAKYRHDKFARMQQADQRIWSQLNALKEPPKLKHKSYFEIAENADKKKKLEFQVDSGRHVLDSSTHIPQVTTDPNPPPGFEFIPTGHPELTTVCKEISREQDAMIFIVSDVSDVNVLDHHLHRKGYHFRQRIVETGRESLRAEGFDERKEFSIPGQPEKIPEDKIELFRQADAVLRDLFPRIPNTDRHEIIQHAFDKDNKFFNGRVKVGLAAELTLARRVQLAALAHIRHTKTRYDQLLDEGVAWENARKAVEQPCLDVIVKWRGDEETGRDQLDEILREVIEISDSEDDSDDENSSVEPIPAEISTAYSTGSAMYRVAAVGEATARLSEVQAIAGSSRPPSLVPPPPTNQNKVLSRREKKAAKQAQQRFKRYAQVAESFRTDLHAPESIYDGNAHNNNNNRAQGDLYMPDHEPQILRELRTDISHAPREQPMSGPSHPGPSRVNNDSPRNRIRGQSPVLVRAGDNQAPKVGSRLVNPGHSHVPLSPVRRQFQDMLVPSIEPRSPGVSRSRDYSPYQARTFESDSEASHLMARTIGRQSLQRPHPDMSGYASEAEISSKRRRISTRHTGRDPGLFSDEGFIRINPAERPRVTSYAYMADNRPSEAIIPTSRDFGTRTPPSVIFIGERRQPGHMQVSARTRTDPIIIDSPSGPGRSMHMHHAPAIVDRDRLAFRRTEVIREPLQTVRHTADRPQVVYFDEPDPRVVRVREYPVESRGHPIALLQPAARQYETLVPYPRQTADFGSEIHGRPASGPRLESRPVHVIRDHFADQHNPLYETTQGDSRPVPEFPPQTINLGYRPDNMRYRLNTPPEPVPGSRLPYHGQAVVEDQHYDPPRRSMVRY
ncbi:hypothetical protein BX600DRAFT_507035 [Xylariales sp. PMI_506]|nr:hypothetical protein BX600DRAFT_507035 [Xylariales sp. PMI_506]